MIWIPMQQNILGSENILSKVVELRLIVYFKLCNILGARGDTVSLYLEIITPSKLIILIDEMMNECIQSIKFWKGVELCHSRITNGM